MFGLECTHNEGMATAEQLNLFRKQTKELLTPAETAEVKEALNEFLEDKVSLFNSTRVGLLWRFMCVWRVCSVCVSVCVCVCLWVHCGLTARALAISDITYNCANETRVMSHDSRAAV